MNMAPPLRGGSPGLLDHSNDGRPMRKKNKGNQDLWFLLLLFKGCAFLCYFMLPIVFSHILVYIVVLILIAIDFWVCKNIVGRKLVKLRWWWAVDDTKGGAENWFFEHRWSKYNLTL